MNTSIIEHLKPNIKSLHYSITNRRLGKEVCCVSINGYYPNHCLDLNKLKGKKVLDIGSGEGGFVKDLRKNDINAFSIDFNKAKHVNIGSHCRANATQMPFKSGIFDVIYSTWSLFSYSESQEIQIKALKEMSRVLKQGGKIRLSPINLNKIRELINVSKLPLQITKNDYIPIQKLFKETINIVKKSDNPFKFVEITKIQ